MSYKQKVLVIDDEKSNLKILSEALKSEVDVILSLDSEQGISKAIEFQPDLILLDIVMPKLDGFAVIERLKNNPKTSSIPVIFVTGEIDVRKEEKGLEAGACDYIQKPFHVAILKARVRLHLTIVKQRKMLEELACIDPLTSIANRRLYDEVFAKEWQAAIEQETPFSLVVIDIDDFKLYNDFFGHAAGDRALEQVALAFSRTLTRPRDFIARYGGEEFVALLPNTRAGEAKNILQSCLEAVEALKIAHVHNAAAQYLTVSIGGVTYFPNALCSQDTLFKLADDMLYQAKSQGKNRLLWKDCN